MDNGSHRTAHAAINKAKTKNKAFLVCLECVVCTNKVKC